jgi:hypothetical protein
MEQLFVANISWLYSYFNKNKSLLEIFSFLIVAQSFIYSANTRELGQQSVDAFKIVLWIMVFFVILLLQISTAVDIGAPRQRRLGSIFKGANFIKIIMRLLTFTLLLASISIFVKEIQMSLHNSLFSVFYGSLILIVVLESVAFAAAFVLPRSGISKDL